MVNNNLLLIDGSFYLYRAYHAFPQLTNKYGEPTGAIYGMINMLNKLLLQYHTNKIAVIFDDQSLTFRHKLYKDYKKNRTIMPHNLYCQINPLYEIIKAMGLPILMVQGVESDDVIGTLAKEAAYSGSNVLISTGDKDMAQLVSNQINLINTISNTILGPKEVKHKFGVPPELIIDYLALMGDKSDNIPGVPGIGKKTAKVLINKLGGINILFNNLNQIINLSLRGKRNIVAKLEQNRDIAFLSYKLATINTNVKLDINYHQLMLKEHNYEKLILLFKIYEFNLLMLQLKLGKWRWLKKTATTVVINSSNPMLIKHHCELTEKLSKQYYKVIYQITELKQLIADIRSAGFFSFDITTDVKDIYTANLVGFCFAISSGKAAYLPVGHNYCNAPNQLSVAQVLYFIKKIFEDVTIVKIGYNLKFNYLILKFNNINLAGSIFDIMLESYVLNSVSCKHNIESLANYYLNYNTVRLNTILGIGRNKLKFNKISIQIAANYANEYTDIMLRLHNLLWPCIEAIPDLKKIFNIIEIPLLLVLARIESTGVMIDENLLANYSIDVNHRLYELKVAAYKLAKEYFNISSTKQLITILYDKHKLPVLKKTPSGVPSTNEEVLRALAKEYKLPKIILDYRCLAKLKSNYLDKLPLLINQKSKRLHTSYNQEKTATGRLSSSSPNLQNIPVRYEVGRLIRRAFIAQPNFFIVVADYSQIELRILAHLSRDMCLSHAFYIGQDIHLATAAEIFNISIDDVTTDQRSRAKTINFGLIYGMSSFGLARKLSVPISEAEKYIKFYFARYPYVRQYMDTVVQQAKEQGYVSTIYGRRLYLPEINKKSTERAAINAPMQGTSADIIKIAMIAIDKWLQQEAPQVCMIMQVHDELVFEVHKNIIISATNSIRKIMEGCVSLDIPLKVDIRVGKNWDEVS
ncbi:DNA polymerase I [Candidatus Palibaumannia cicadellinicola]|uniref:DNA polymerase I n=1 Tax=Candidatus Palibaumannia cicadellinicola TaxID=186490 RepID=A0A0K2BKY8_9GAMM|nr:DNA polymerase I [Candidatus Baumannia cicadellinicola]AKZ65713.1 DNA polymerase I [Candidatus Baumannia cicadellinicola]